MLEKGSLEQKELMKAFTYHGSLRDDLSFVSATIARKHREMFLKKSTTKLNLELWR